MTQKQILVIIHEKNSSSGAIGHILREQGYHLDIRCPAHHDPLPTHLDHHEAVVVFGGFMSANDDRKLSFIRQELDWLPIALDTGKPFLGICLGAQLLAKLLGGKVAPHPEGVAEIGYYPIQPIVPPIKPNDRLSPPHKHFSTPRYVYHWHEEGIELPQTATKLAGGDTFSTQAFSYGGHAFGVQFHPEITTPLIERWLTVGKAMLNLPGAQDRDEQLKNHALYGESCQHWLQDFLISWLLSSPEGKD